MRRMSRAAGALKTALGRRGSIRSKILAGFTVILVGMLSINLLVIGLSHHFLGEYHILAERVISANKLIPTVRDDVSLDAYYLVAGRRTLETTQLFHHMEEIRQGLYLLKQENNSENGRIQLQIATRTFGTLQRYCQKLGQEIDADVSLELQNVTLEQIRDVSALVYNQIEEYIYLELLWGESIDQMLQTGFQLLLLGDLAAVVLMVAVLAFLLMRINRTINDPIQALVENTRRLAEGDFDALMEDAGENEVTILNKSFNRMAAKLQPDGKSGGGHPHPGAAGAAAASGTDQSPLSLQHAGDHRLAGGVRGQGAGHTGGPVPLPVFPGGPQQRPRSGVPSGGAVLHPKLSLYSESALCRYPEL